MWCHDVGNRRSWCRRLCWSSGGAGDGNRTRVASLEVKGVCSRRSQLFCRAERTVASCPRVSVTVSHGLPYLARIWHGPASTSRLSGGHGRAEPSKLCEGASSPANCRACTPGCPLGYEEHGPRPIALELSAASTLVQPPVPARFARALLPSVIRLHACPCGPGAGACGVRGEARSRGHRKAGPRRLRKTPRPGQRLKRRRRTSRTDSTLFHAVG
jgi:hypothetical protein